MRNVVEKISVEILILVVSLTTPVLSAWADSIEVLNANGNDVIDLSKSDIVNFHIDWNNKEPIILRVHLGKIKNDAGVTFAGTICNTGSTQWNGFHVTLKGGAVWQPITTISHLPNNVLVQNPPDLETNIISYNTCNIDTILLCEYCELHNVGESATKRESADFAFGPALPSGGLLAIGIFNNKGLNWSIDRHGLQDGESFIVELAPNIYREKLYEQ